MVLRAWILKLEGWVGWSYAYALDIIVQVSVRASVWFCASLRFLGLRPLNSGAYSIQNLAQRLRIQAPPHSHCLLQTGPESFFEDFMGICSDPTASPLGLMSRTLTPSRLGPSVLLQAGVRALGGRVRGKARSRLGA